MSHRLAMRLTLRRSAALFVALLLAGCGPTGGGNAGSLNGSGTVPIPMRASRDVLTVDVTVHLRGGSARLDLVSPTGARKPAAMIVGPSDFQTQMQEPNATGSWTAVWTLTNADGDYELRWSY